MRESLLQMLDCPKCRAGRGLLLAATESHGDDVIRGQLTCPACGRQYLVSNGIPRFVEPSEDYCKNFGFQWQRWKEIQIDRLAHHHHSENRFFDEVPWDREWMRGRLILDAGCGAGRFADVAAMYGAQVVACDLSNAIDACREVTSAHGPTVHHVQASIYELPFRRRVFDAAYCFGVIQHTPDPVRTMEAVPAYLKAGGQLAYDFYQRTSWERPYVPRWMFRRFTPSWPEERTLLLAQALTAAFFPVGMAMNRLPPLRAFFPALPIAFIDHPDLSLKQNYTWALLDTFDWYSPAYEQRQDYREVAKLLSRAGMQDIVARPGVVTARSPGPALT